MHIIPTKYLLRRVMPLKIFLYILMSSALIAISGCFEEEDIQPAPCAEVECDNGFFCVDGDCLCPDGYKIKKGRCYEISNADYLLRNAFGDTSCFSDFYSMSVLPIDGFEYPPEYFQLHIYSLERPHEDSIIFKDKKHSLHNDFPVRGVGSSIYGNLAGFPCKKEAEDDILNMEVKWDVYMDRDSIRLTADYLHEPTGDTLGEPTIFHFTRN